MPLNNIITHRIQRETPETPSSITLSDTCWEVNGKTEECFRELRQTVIKRLGKEYGQFSKDTANHPVSSWLHEFSKEKISFESFSKKAMQHLKSEIDKTSEMIDGFFIFADEKLEIDHVAHIFFAQQDTAQYIDGNLAISESLYMDTSDVRLAAKINLSDWLGQDKHKAAKSVTLLRWRGEKELSEAFTDFVGFDDKLDIAQETEKFLDLVSDYTKELPEDIGYHTKTQVVNYCLEKNKAGEPVIIDELSTQLKENPVRTSKTADSTEPNDASSETSMAKQELATFVAKSQPDAKPEIIPDTSLLRQYVRISGRNDQISVSFTAGCLGDSIIYDPETDSLTIKAIPSGLKTRLAKHFQNT